VPGIMADCGTIHSLDANLSLGLRILVQLEPPFDIHEMECGDLNRHCVRQ
jgi:hypothetical protein